MHILDIARNSIEAGASEIEIIIEDNTVKDVFSFTVRDNGPGMKEELIPLILDPFFTTKEKTKKVGLGLSMLKAATERCEGSFKIDTSPGKGTAVTACFRRSHIDMAPLGDISGTITVLLTEPGLKKLTYSFEVDGRRFGFSLKSLQEKMGSIPLNSPAVLCLVRNHLEEGVSKLYGGAKIEVSG